MPSNCLMKGFELSSLLSSGCLASRLFPKLTLCELLRCTQISKDLRHGLRDEDTWQAALTRSLPADHALQNPTTSYQTAAIHHATVQQIIESGGDAALLTCAASPSSTAQPKPQPGCLFYHLTLYAGPQT